MNEQKSIYDAYQEIKQREIEELEKKLRRFGGVAHFGPDYTGDGATGVDCPIVLCNFDCGPADIVIKAICIDSDDIVTILGYDRDAGQDIEVLYEEIAYGHIAFIADAIPEERGVWMRLGVTVTGTKEEIEAIVSGSDEGDEILARLLKKGNYKINGNSYIPSDEIDNYNLYYGTNHLLGDLEFELNL